MPESKDYTLNDWSHPDPEYIVARENLISEAEDIARQRVKEIGKRGNWRKGVDGKKFKWDYFSSFFHKAMNELAKERIWGGTTENKTLNGNVRPADTSTASENISEQPANAS